MTPADDPQAETPLHEERCVACRRDSPHVTPDEIKRLSPLIPEWVLDERDGHPALERRFDFPSEAAAHIFVERLGAEAEQEGHHPQIDEHGSSVTVRWWTFAIRGLHRNDFVMAARSDEIARWLPARE